MRPTPSSSQKPPAIAITGLGIVSALGTGPEEWSAAAAEGESVIEPVPDGWAPSREPSYAALARHFDLAPLLETRKAYVDRHTALLLGALAFAIRQATANTSGYRGNPRTGLMTGSGWGAIGTMHTFFQDVLAKGPKFAKPILFPHAYANTAAAMAAIEWQLQGPHEHFEGGLLASGHALLAALDTLRAGDADRMFAGGCEAVSPALLKVTSLCLPATPPLAPGDCAAALALEPAGPAQARNARILGWIRGVGASGSSARDALLSALAESAAATSDLGAILLATHPAVPVSLIDDLHALFTDDDPLIVDLARLQGHALGASTLLNVVAGTLFLQTGWIPAGTCIDTPHSRASTPGSPITLSADKGILVLTGSPEGFLAVFLSRPCGTP